MKLKVSIVAFSLCVVVIWLVSFLAGNGTKDPHIIAEYKGGTIGEQEHVEYQNIMQFFTPGVSQQLTESEYMKKLLMEHIAYKVMEERGRSITQQSQTTVAKAQWDTFKKQYEISFSFNGESLQQRLSKLHLSEAVLTGYIEGQIYGSLYLKSTLDQKALENDYKLNASLHNYDMFDVSQIQISFKPDGLKPRTSEEALKRAKEVIAKLKADEDFSMLTQQYSDDPSLQTNGGQYLNTPIYGLDSDIKQAILDLPLRQISQPLPAESGYYIIRVDKRSTQTYEESMEALMNERVQAAYTDFIAKELSGLIIQMNPQ
ncbi:peptidylprolyl isomerase [Paenibacillus psychroresistens]|nr:peptidylprolyl isomerase [Paenibacillus psychroresistens]